MKKTLTLVVALLLALVLLSACGADEGSSSSPAESGSEAASGGASAEVADGKLNPPAWLIGEWVTDEPMQDITVTSSNVVAGSGNLDMTWQMENVHLEVAESTSENFYELTYSMGELDFSYAFTNQGDGTMICKTSVDGLGFDVTYTRK